MLWWVQCITPRASSENNTQPTLASDADARVVLVADKVDRAVGAGARAPPPPHAGRGSVLIRFHRRRRRRRRGRRRAARRRAISRSVRSHQSIACARGNKREVASSFEDPCYIIRVYSTKVLAFASMANSAEVYRYCPHWLLVCTAPRHLQSLASQNAFSSSFMAPHVTCGR